MREGSQVSELGGTIERDMLSETQDALTVF